MSTNGWAVPLTVLPSRSSACIKMGEMISRIGFGMRSTHINVLLLCDVCHGRAFGAISALLQIIRRTMEQHFCRQTIIRFSIANACLFKYLDETSV